MENKDRVVIEDVASMVGDGSGDCGRWCVCTPTALVVAVMVANHPSPKTMDNTNMELPNMYI
jgi:hypothetical protein